MYTNDGNQIVSASRGRGCSTVVVKHDLVNDDQMTGGTETCILIDGSNNNDNYGRSSETKMKQVHENVMQCRAHNRKGCSECLKPVQKCHAMLRSEVTPECGRKLPVIADTSF